MRYEWYNCGHITQSWFIFLSNGQIIQCNKIPFNFKTSSIDGMVSDGGKSFEMLEINNKMVCIVGISIVIGNKKLKICLVN